MPLRTQAMQKLQMIQSKNRELFDPEKPNDSACFGFEKENFQLIFVLISSFRPAKYTKNACQLFDEKDLFILILFHFQDICGVSSLIDKYLGQHYPFYFECTRDVLIRQARDILVCTFHGDLTSFEEIFLKPAVSIIEKIKQNYPGGDMVSNL